MPGTHLAFVHEAELQLEHGTDLAAVGAAVTTALCGHWEHEGPCRWPHNNSTESSDVVANFRTLFLATASDEDEVRTKIERSLREGVGWTVLATRARKVSARERSLAERLAIAPRS
jgi:hypothetical protein